MRVLTVCDIYAALIERRSYKAPMPSRKAFAILEGMTGRLDATVLEAFRPVAAAFVPRFPRIHEPTHACARVSPPRLGSLPRTWIGMGILVPVGMVAVCTVMLADLRRDAWDKAEQTSRNLLQVIERDIDRNIEIIDIALQNVVENLKMPDLEEISPKYRQRILFDRAVSAKDLNALLVLDQYGNCIYDAAGWPARRFNKRRSGLLSRRTGTIPISGSASANP